MTQTPHPLVLLNCQLHFPFASHSPRNCPSLHFPLGCCHPAQTNTAASMIARRARGTIQCLNKARPLSTTAPAAAITPHRKAAQASNSKQSTEASKRAQSTSTATATQDRARPSPAFNREDPQRWKEVQPLKPYKGPELDYSFVGMTGGEIVHEMLMRQNVKHVCESRHQYQSSQR